MKRAKNRQLQHCVGARGTTVPLAGSCVAVRPSSRRVQPPAGAAGAAANTCGCSSCPGHVQQGRPRAPAPCGHDAPTHPALRNRRQLVPKQPCRHASLQQDAVVIVGSRGHSSLVLAWISSGTPQILTGTGRAVGVPWWPPCSGLLPPCCQRAAMHKPHKPCRAKPPPGMGPAGRRPPGHVSQLTHPLTEPGVAREELCWPRGAASLSPQLLRPIHQSNTKPRMLPARLGNVPRARLTSSPNITTM